MMVNHSILASQQKIAEKLTILNDRGIGMLTRISNIKKVFLNLVINIKFIDFIKQK